MQSLFENGINLLETFLFTEFMTRYFGTKFKGARKYACFAVAWLLAFVFMCVMNYVVVVETVATVGFIIIVLCVRYVLPKRKMADQAPFVRRHLLSCLCHRDFNQSYSVQRDWL